MATVIGPSLPARSQHQVVQPVRGPPPRALIDAGTTTAQTERMRLVSVQLADEIMHAARCHPRDRGFEPCVSPALRHAVMGGRLAAFVLRTVLAPVPTGRCRRRLIDLQAANAAASELAQWALSGLYDRSRRARRHEAAVQVAYIASMLTRSANSMARACSPADGPPA